MKILGIDTSSAVLSIGVTEGDMVLGELVQNKALTHSEKLMPHIAYLLDMLDENIAAMDCFAVTVGPGSFTGIRIGVATANAFALAHGKKVIEISTLEALAQNFFMSDAIVIATMYAQRDDYYRGIYTFEQSEAGIHMIVLEAEAALSSAEIMAEASTYAQQKTVIFVGEITKNIDLASLSENTTEIQNKNLIKVADFTDNYIRASILCKMARERLEKSDAAPLPKYATPVYIRKPQAEVEYEERHRTNRTTGK